MKIGCRPYQDKTAIILAQLGTPDAPTAKALRPYLREFLSDQRVIELNRFFWQLLLNFIILPTRSPKSARNYARIWTREGSPLAVITKRLTEKMRGELHKLSPDLIVDFGMRYGSSSLKDCLQRVTAAGARRVVILPLYPQYSASTSASIYDAVFQTLGALRWVPTLGVVEPFYNDGDYLEVLARSLESQLRALPTMPEVLLLSFHGVPTRYVRMGDPYCCMCTETTSFLSDRLKHLPVRILQSFQSRFGPEPWLTPYTDKYLEELARQGTKSIAVACPGFTADCLETLDEIGNEARETFCHAGGADFHYLTCLNDEDAFVQYLLGKVQKQLECWGVTGGETRRCSLPCVTCPSSMEYSSPAQP